MHFTFFDSSFVESMAWMLIHSTWQISTIAIVLFILLKVLPQRLYNVRYWVSYGSLLLILGASYLTFQSYQSTEAVHSAIIVSGTMESIDCEVVPIINEASSTHQDPLLEPSYIFILWLLGSIVLFGRMLIQFYQINRLKSTAIPLTDTSLLRLHDTLIREFGITRDVLLRTSQFIASPATFGFFRPIILFPISVLNRLSIEEAEMILAHELAHIKRADYIFNIIQNVIQTIFYFHPGIWWIQMQIRTQREICCDIHALRFSSDTAAYANMLMKLESFNMKGSNMLLQSFNGGNSQLKNRVLSIFQQPIKQSINMEKVIAFAAILAWSLSFAHVDSTKQAWYDLCYDQISQNEASITFGSQQQLDVNPYTVNHATSLTTVLTDTIPKETQRIVTVQRVESRNDEKQDTVIKELKISVNEDLETVEIDTIVRKIVINDREETVNIDTIKEKVIIIQNGDGEEIQTIKIQESGSLDFRTEPNSNIQHNKRIIIGDQEVQVSIDKALAKAEKAYAEALESSRQNIDSILAEVHITIDGIGHDFDFEDMEIHFKNSDAFKHFENIEDLGEKLNFDIDFDTHNFGIPHEDMSVYFLDEGAHFDTDFITLIEDVLIEEGLISSDDVYSLDMNKQRLKINGKKQSSEVFNKYRALYKEITGNSFTGNSKLKIKKTPGNSSIRMHHSN